MAAKENAASGKAALARAGAQRRRERDRRRRSEQKPVKPFVRSTAPRATPESVELVPMHPARVRGARRLGWHLWHEGRRAGTVAILCHEVEGHLTKASIDVQLNAPSHGRGIGTVAFRRASELSGFNEVFAIIAKKNVASHAAATRAGFTETKDVPGSELTLVWRRGTP